MKSVRKKTTHRWAYFLYFFALFIIVSIIFAAFHDPRYSVNPSDKGWMRHGKPVICHGAPFNGKTVYRVQYGFPFIDERDSNSPNSASGGNPCVTAWDSQQFTPQFNLLALGINYIVWIAAFHYLIKYSRKLAGNRK